MFLVKYDNNKKVTGFYHHYGDVAKVENSIIISDDKRIEYLNVSDKQELFVENDNIVIRDKIYTEEELENLKRLEKEIKIAQLQNELNNIKQDIEQVELFGLIREDYNKLKDRAKALYFELCQLKGKQPKATMDY